MATPWPCGSHDYSCDMFEQSVLPSLQGTSTPLSSSLVFSCVFPETVYLADNDFQSNHMESDLNHRYPTLAGLGIKNLAMDDIAELCQSYSEHTHELACTHSQSHQDQVQHNVTKYGELVTCTQPLEKTPRLRLSITHSRSTEDYFRDEVVPSPSFGLKHNAISDNIHTSDLALSFEQLSASTGLSVADFAAHISATAEMTLKRMAAEESLTGNFCHAYRASFHIGNSVSIDTGVNPADILPSSPSLSGDMVLLHHSNSHSSETTVLSDSSTGNMAVSGFSEAFVKPMVQEGIVKPSNHIRPLFRSPSSSEYSPTLSTGQKRPTANKQRKRGSRIRSGKDSSPEYPDEHDPTKLPPINIGTPVFDAHRGIDIEILKAKAERYRLRNQGRDYDKRWLLSFAGKLSPQGELVEEFRCYISGCMQSNKRRDHILIHVGAHLDQRPFKCMHCSSRFLRKNECKRHELSHTGIRPFACPFCVVPPTTFVRQDLLKRHMKRTHKIQYDDKENQEEAYRPRKRARH